MIESRDHQHSFSNFHTLLTGINQGIVKDPHKLLEFLQAGLQSLPDIVHSFNTPLPYGEQLILDLALNSMQTALEGNWQTKAAYCSRIATIDFEQAYQSFAQGQQERADKYMLWAENWLEMSRACDQLQEPDEGLHTGRLC